MFIKYFDRVGRGTIVGHHVWIQKIEGRSGKPMEPCFLFDQSPFTGDLEFYFGDNIATIEVEGNAKEVSIDTGS